MLKLYKHKKFSRLIVYYIVTQFRHEKLFILFSYTKDLSVAALFSILLFTFKYLNLEWNLRISNNV